MIFEHIRQARIFFLFHKEAYYGLNWLDKIELKFWEKTK